MKDALEDAVRRIALDGAKSARVRIPAGHAETVQEQATADAHNAAMAERVSKEAQAARGTPAPAVSPCPFCGHVGLDFAEGSTYRWIVASCGGCGATTGETRIQTFGEGTREEWFDDAKRDAIAAWNRRVDCTVGGASEAEAMRGFPSRILEVLRDMANPKDSDGRDCAWEDGNGVPLNADAAEAVRWIVQRAGIAPETAAQSGGANGGEA